MAKTPKLKKKLSSVHSRAARRASSPSLNLDKSLKSAKAPTESAESTTNGSSKSNHARPSVLAIHQGAGVSKKSATSRAQRLSTKQRRRREKGVEKATHVVDKLEKKVKTSAGRSRTVKDRRAAWEDLNQKFEAREKKREKDGNERAEGRGDAAITEVTEGMSLEAVPQVIPAVPEATKPHEEGASDVDEIL